MDTWTDKLSEYLDDELSPADRRAVEEHLAGCPDCARTLDELQQVLSRARALPARPPAGDLWTGIESRIAATGVARFRSRLVQRVSFTVPQLAAAAVLIAAVSSAVAIRIAAPRFGGARPQATAGTAPQSATPTPASTAPETLGATTVSLADAQYDAAVTDLERALNHGRGRLDPSTVAAIEQSLQTIDQAIEQARQALEQDPANSYLTGHLVETRRRKLELLRRAAALAETN